MEKQRDREERLVHLLSTLVGQETPTKSGTRRIAEILQDLHLPTNNTNPNTAQKVTCLWLESKQNIIAVKGEGSEHAHHQPFAIDDVPIHDGIAKCRIKLTSSLQTN